MSSVREILADTSLEYFQKKHRLAAWAEGTLAAPAVSSATTKLMADGVVCDMAEGPAPYRPRYVLPDYEQLLRQGSTFLGLQPVHDLHEAMNALQIAYHYVPSITGLPVFLGQIDKLLEPFRTTVPEATWRKLIENFLVYIDRTMPDAFVHANLGAEDTPTARLVLQLERQQRKAVPNLSLKVSTATSDELLLEAVQTALVTGKPYFVHDAELAGTFGGAYGIASCYNTLPIGGGSHSLVRLDLRTLAHRASSPQRFLDEVLPAGIAAVAEVLRARIAFLVEEVRFFDSSFLVREGLISLSRFTAMVGVFGLHEAVCHLTGGAHMGSDAAANDLARTIVARAHALVKSEPARYCEATNGKLGFHAQAGLDTDSESTPGVRIRIGKEPHPFDQIALQAELQRWFDTGVSDICIFDATARGNPQAVLRIIRGAFEKGMRILAINTNDSELVRVSGYLVKRTDLESIKRGESVREQTASIASVSIERMRVFERAVRTPEG